MATEVLMPKLGLTMTEGTIEEWKFKEGDTVKKGDTSDTQRTLEWRHTFTAVPYFGKVPEWRG